MNIENVNQSDYTKLIEIWEASVRATHDFLREEDILLLKPLILENYFNVVKLKCVRNDSKQILGFIGVANRKIEMLFIHPQYFGQGLGTKLVKFAIEELKVNTVDVNEQNPNARGFYEHIGF